MRSILTFSFFLFFLLTINAQESVHFLSSKSSVKLPFKLVKNLIILPIKINGTSLNFLVDTGIKETILFSLDEGSKLPLYNIEKLKLKGLGSKGSIEGLKAYRNTLSVNGLEFRNQEVVVILDQEFNFSSVLGIEVNGIVGYQFFNQGIIHIDYDKKQIIVYNPKKYNEKKIISGFSAYDFMLEEYKPYIKLQVQINDKMFDAKCLIDSGNSDGLWLFSGKSEDIVVPERNFEDYLGRGFSGDVYGKKASVNALSLGDYNFKNVVTAFPYQESYSDLKMVANRIGSVGGEFLRRFNVIFDYQNQKLYLKKNKYYNEKFRYNITGITVHHAGMQWFKEEIKSEGLFLSTNMNKTNNFLKDLKYNFRLTPLYEILSIRKNSTAEKAGIQPGDELVEVNGRIVSRMSLDGINQLLRVDGQKEVRLIVLRNGQKRYFRFKTLDLL
jgi:hypothetical protein